MVSLATAYWMGLAAADSARDHRRMWNLATRATGRQQAPVDDRAALIDQVTHLQAQLQQVIEERDKNYRAWLAESTAHKETQAELNTIVNTWSPF